MTDETEHETENDSSVFKKEEQEEPRKEEKSGKRTQRQVLQESLGLAPGTIEKIEEKLFIARFIDYFSEELFDFMHRDKAINNYKDQIKEKIEAYAKGTEEEKILKQSFENKQILSIVDQLKSNTEKFASENGWNTSVDKKIRNFSLLTTIPMLAFLVINTILDLLNLISVPFTFLLPILCVFCFVPQIVKSYYANKWYSFKDDNKMELFEKNRSDIMILKNFAGEVLENVRSNLIEHKVPLQLIKFILSSRDYETVKVIKKKSQKNVTQYLVNFAYPLDVEPFPIPASLSQMQTQTPEDVEKNFVVLENIKIEDGIIKEFIPSLKEKLANDINKMLNKCDFVKASEDLDTILPNYSPEMSIYCKCGEMVEIESARIANWKGEFQFYLFEGRTCECGEKVYAISLMGQEQEIPKELSNIF